MQVDTPGSVEFYKLGEICQTNSESYSEKENWSEAYYLDTGNITENKIESIQYFDLRNEKLPSRAKRKVSDGEIIYSTVRPNQKHYGIIKNPPKHFLVSTGFTTIKVNEEICDSKYVYYYLTQDTIIAHLQALAEQTVSTYPSIKASDIENLEIPLPPLPIQKKIASILSSLDDKIELNTRMNKVLEEIARALFQRWFVEFEFPDAEGRPYKSAGGKMGEDKMASVPEGWKVTSLDQIAEYMNGIACQKYPPSEDEDSMAVIKIRELRSGNLSEADRVSPSVPEKYHIQNGDVLFSWSGSLMVDIWCSGEGILNQHLFKVSSDTYPKWFYYLWTKHHLQEFQMIAVDKTTTMGHIKRHHLTDAKVVVPSKDVLEIMNGVMSPLISQIIRYNLEINVLTELRDSLLPKLISGELPVPIPSPNNAETGGAD